jgi:glycosyltransferase involved in cell wall biosynthesis
MSASMENTNAKRKLVFIMHDRPNYPGGPIINYRRLLPSLVEKGHEVFLICFYKTDFPNARQISQSQVQIFPFLRSDTKTSVKNILTVLKKIQPDAFIPDVSTPGCFAGKWVQKCGIPVITTLRGNDKNNWGRALYFTDPISKYNVTGVVCVSPYFQDQLINKRGNYPLNSEIIPSGVPVPGTSTNQSIETLHIAYAGRLVNNIKNISQVIHAFIHICSLFSHVKCNLIGDGPEMNACKSMVSEVDLHDRIIFSGLLTDVSYSAQLAQNQIIVLFSDSEGTPGALLDGMACGLIPVVLRYPGVEDLIKHNENGWIIENTNKDFMDAIKTLSGSEELRIRLSEAAKKTISASYSLNTSVMKWENFIETCIQKAKPKKKLAFPKWILLPKYNRMLPEDIRPERKGRLSFFFKFIDRILIT